MNGLFTPRPLTQKRQAFPCPASRDLTVMAPTPSVLCLLSMKTKINLMFIKPSNCRSRNQSPAILVSLAASWLAVSLPAAPASADRVGALTNWQTALSVFKRAGTFIGQNKIAEATERIRTLTNP